MINKTKTTTMSEHFQNPIEKSKKRGKIDYPNTNYCGGVKLK